MSTVIVTGGTGFLGSWLLQELLQHDYKVIAVVRDARRLLPELRRACIIIERSIEDLSPEDFPEGLSYGACFHLAWSGVAPQEKNNIAMQIRNIEISLHMLDVAQSLECSRFLVTGSVAEYAFCDGVMDLNTQQQPNDLYGAAKTAAQYLMDVRARQIGMPFLWMIVPSTFGERRTDKNIVTYTIKTLLSGEKPIYGDLRQMWDFLYVGEVVRAIRLLSERGIPGKIYGIGSGEYRPLYEYIQAIKNFIDPGLTLGIGEFPSMSAKTYASCVNIYDLCKDTGYRPMIGFEEGIRRTINYWRKCGVS